MKKILCTSLFLMVGIMLTGGSWAADKEAIEKLIKKQVDEVVAAIDSGKKAEDFEYLSEKEPYFVFIMEQGGKLLVRPVSLGKNLKESGNEIDKGIYKALVKATTEGLWVEYPLHGTKRVYAKKTQSGLIVASGYHI